MDLKMALGRLLFPVELGEKAEEHYLSHIREHLVEAARILTKEKVTGAWELFLRE